MNRAIPPKWDSPSLVSQTFVISQRITGFMPPPRILIAEDHRLIAELYTHLLRPQFLVVGIVSDGQSLLRKAHELRPDLVIADISLPLLSGLKALTELRQRQPKLKIVVATMNDDSEIATEAFRRGANGYFLKTETARSLLKAIQEVLNGGAYASSPLSIVRPSAFEASPGA